MLLRLVSLISVLLLTAITGQSAVLERIALALPDASLASRSSAVPLRQAKRAEVVARASRTRPKRADTSALPIQKYYLQVVESGQYISLSNSGTDPNAVTYAFFQLSTTQSNQFYIDPTSNYLVSDQVGRFAVTRNTNVYYILAVTEPARSAYGLPTLQCSVTASLLSCTISGSTVPRVFCLTGSSGNYLLQTDTAATCLSKTGGQVINIRLVPV